MQNTNDITAGERTQTIGHTPGPWDALESKTLIHIETPVTHATPGIAICSIPKRDKANAKLIAAAPELLMVLKLARDYAADISLVSSDNVLDRPAIARMIDAVIAKATN